MELHGEVDMNYKDVQWSLGYSFTVGYQPALQIVCEMSAKKEILWTFHRWTTGIDDDDVIFLFWSGEFRYKPKHELQFSR